ncbi:hypothetical protein H4Q26_005524 [Puccinia striiformis f. sp. tritici PST-130]|nr:hypothetical protein H4Q26_005524 [Puccinia striiformis f. sp. tritici PST-130]
MHQVFKAFGEKDKQIITLYSLEAKILELGTELQKSHHITQEFKQNWASFSVQEYTDTLNKIMNHSTQSTKCAKKGIIEMEISVDERNQIKLQVEKMIQLLQELDLNPNSYNEYNAGWLDIPMPLYCIFPSVNLLISLKGTSSEALLKK